MSLTRFLEPFDLEAQFAAAWIAEEDPVVILTLLVLENPRNAMRIYHRVLREVAYSQDLGNETTRDASHTLERELTADGPCNPKAVEDIVFATFSLEQDMRLMAGPQRLLLEAYNRFLHVVQGVLAKEFQHVMYVWSIKQAYYALLATHVVGPSYSRLGRTHGHERARADLARRFKEGHMPLAKDVLCVTTQHAV